MPNCNFNGCFTGSYYPRQIFTNTCMNRCTSGTITNPQPVLQWAVFNLQNAGEVQSGEVLDVALSSSSGAAIKDLGGGQISLSAGTYQVMYNAGAILVSDGLVSLELRLNGATVVGSNSLWSGQNGDNLTLNNSIIINLTDAAVLTLVNTGSTSSYNFASLSIQKL